MTAGTSGSSPPRRLGVVVSGEWPEFSPGAENTMIAGIASDSRKVRPGDLFVAIRGEQYDGHDFIPDAVRAGAAAVLLERAPEDLDAPWVRVRNTRSSLGSVASVFHGDPSEAVSLAGVTGTNGKTSTCWLLDSAFFQLSGASLMSGTLGARLRTADFVTGSPAGLTTGDAAEFQALLADARRRGCRFGAIECSSHGLHQGRLGGAFFRAAAFTNLTPEHLDYHNDMEAYYEAKRLLFTENLRSSGVAAIGTDDPRGVRLERELATSRPDVVISSFGFARAATVRILGMRQVDIGQEVRLGTPDGEQQIRTSMPGDFAARNLAGAWTVLFGMDFPPCDITEALAATPPPPGRMERVRLPESPNAPLVFVDFAHTPDALEQALGAARRLAGSGRLWVVFGCGGERDPEKRAPMGRIAARLADRVVLTSDNSRGEDPEQILAAIREGVDEERPGAMVFSTKDRVEAIHHAIGRAGPGDVVLIAGRGAESHLVTAGGRIPADDRDLVRQALREEAR